MPTARCAACGRRLRRPSTTGLGPVCERRLRPRTAACSTTAVVISVPVQRIEGQTELDLHDHQPTLWSL